MNDLFWKSLAIIMVVVGAVMIINGRNVGILWSVLGAVIYLANHAFEE